MSYPILLTLHLFGALIFIGVVFFEVLFLNRIRAHVRPEVMRELDVAIGQRARALMPWVLLVLYSAGLAMAWRYRTVLVDPLSSSFGTLLAIKVLLALSVFGHFVRAMTWRRAGQLTARRTRIIHLSLFTHMVGIVLLAKGMFFLTW